MNKARRKRLTELLDQLQNVRIDIDELREEEETAYNNLPESLQEAERGEKMYDIVTQLEDVVYSLEEAEADLSGALEE